MRIIGLVGGVASGKSLVAQELQQLGAAVVDADRAGHEILQMPKVIETLTERWGDRVVELDRRQLSRRAIAEIVFAPTPEGRRELDFLTSVTHPLIGKQTEKQIALCQAEGRKVVVLDAPVMLEAGWDRLCDEIWYVDAPHGVRLERALSRGWTAEQFAAREAAQMPVDEKRRRADRVIDNSGPAEATRQQVQRIWREIEP